MLKIILTVLTVLLVDSGEFSLSQESSKLQRDSLMQRRRQLVAALDRVDHISYQAAAELAVLKNLERPDWEALIALISRKARAEEPVSVRYIGALSTAGAAAVPDMLAALQPIANSEARTDLALSYALLASLGRMGPAAKEAIPTLRRMVADPKS